MRRARRESKTHFDAKPPAIKAGGFVSLGWQTSIELIATSNKALS